MQNETQTNNQEKNGTQTPPPNRTDGKSKKIPTHDWTDFIRVIIAGLVVIVIFSLINDASILGSQEAWNILHWIKNMGPDPHNKYRFANFLRVCGLIMALYIGLCFAKNWKKYAAVLSPKQNYDTAFLTVLATTEGRLAIDEVSLFPEQDSHHHLLLCG